jgi:hypothetical protein
MNDKLPTVEYPSYSAPMSSSVISAILEAGPAFEYCDKCGPAVESAILVAFESGVMTFCRHCGVQILSNFRADNCPQWWSAQDGMWV